MTSEAVVILSGAKNVRFLEVYMNNKGSTLVLLVIVIALVMVLGASVLNIVVKQYEIKMFNSETKQSFYMSETGLNEAYVRSCILINESIEDALQMAQDYLFVNPSDESEAENIFITNYMLNIRANIKSRIDTGANPSVEIYNSPLTFNNSVLKASLRSSYVNLGNNAKLMWVDLIISVPEFSDVINGGYDVKDYIKSANWNS